MDSQAIFFGIVEDSRLTTDASVRLCGGTAILSLASFDGSLAPLQRLLFG
jgi:hypothetical protein